MNRSGVRALKMKIRGVMARKGDTPDYINKMQQEVFNVLAEARSLEDLRNIEPKVRRSIEVLDELGGAMSGSWQSIVGSAS